MQTTQANEPRVKVIYGSITVDEVKPALNNDQKLRAQLRQVVTKEYPPASTKDSMTDELFSREEFGFTNANRLFEEKRVGWIDVPVGTTVEDVVKKLANLPEARLVKHLSLNVILTDEQASAIQARLTTLETIAAAQVVRNEKEDVVPYGRPGQPEYLQYRVIKFAATAKEDVDTRAEDYVDFITSGVQSPFQVANQTSVIAKAAIAGAEAATAVPAEKF
jgi:hypothetical protein